MLRDADQCTLFFIPSPPLGAGSIMFLCCPSVLACMCAFIMFVNTIFHKPLGEFHLFITLAHLGTNVKLLDF